MELMSSQTLQKKISELDIVVETITNEMHRGKKLNMSDQTNINIVELLKKKRERDLETIVKEVIDKYFFKFDDSYKPAYSRSSMNSQNKKHKENYNKAHYNYKTQN